MINLTWFLPDALQKLREFFHWIYSVGGLVSHFMFFLVMAFVIGLPLFIIALALDGWQLPRHPY